MQKKGRESVRKSAGWHVWQKKILYKYSIGNKWQNTSFGEEKKQVLQWISVQRQSNNVTDGQKFISCCTGSSLGLIYSRRDTGQLERAQKTDPRKSKKNRPLEKTSDLDSLNLNRLQTHIRKGVKDRQRWSKIFLL